MPKPATPSPTAQAILVAAAARDDHLAFPPEHLPTAAKRAVVRFLLRANLLTEVEADEDGPAWRTIENGERLALQLTKAGLTAVGSTTNRDIAADRGVPVTTQDAPVVASKDQQPPEALPTTATDTVELTATGRSSLRAAAQAVLAAWDDTDRNRPALPGAMETLQAVLAMMSTARTRTPAGMPRQPRPDTKRAAVLTLLRRPKGATVAEVADATGWATHTVRGFFANLSKAGTPVRVLERVRQVGPGKQGTKGSYTVYHVAEAR